MNFSEYNTSQLKYLSAILGCKPAEIEYIAAHPDEYYREWFEKKIDKISGDFKRYKDGTVKQRAIRPSLKRLKAIQTAIKTNILAKAALPPNIHGGVKKRNNISNAKPHQGKKYKFTTDLQAFYPHKIQSCVLYVSFPEFLQCSSSLAYKIDDVEIRASAGHTNQYPYSQPCIRKDR